MKNSKLVYVTAYRYIWKNIDGKFCVKIIVGTDEEHKNFMSKLNTSKEVVCASRLYLHEICLNYTEQHEIIKKEGEK